MTGIVAVEDRVQAEPADARQREDHLDDDRAADQHAELQADKGHRVDQRVRRDVAQQEPGVADALRARGVDKVLVQHRLRRDADEADQRRREVERQRDTPAAALTDVLRPGCARRTRSRPTAGCPG